MNKKAEGLSGALIFIFFICLVIWCANNYWRNTSYENMHSSCIQHCINENQTAIGFNHDSKTCECTINSYQCHSIKNKTTLIYTYTIIKGAK